MGAIEDFEGYQKLSGPPAVAPVSPATKELKQDSKVVNDQPKTKQPKQKSPTKP